MASTRKQAATAKDFPVGSASALAASAMALPVASADTPSVPKATVEALDFTTVAPAHGPLGTKADIVAHRQYFENLAARVSAGIAAGQTVEQLQAAQIMNEYKDWIEYDEDNDVNIANAYTTLSEETR